MEKAIFDLSEIKDTNNKISRLEDYQIIKRRFFELALPISSGEYSINKFYQEHILPYAPIEANITYGDAINWSKHMRPHLEKLVIMMTQSQKVQDAMTMVEREQEKLKKQFEIRQDVTDAMHAYVKQLKAMVEDPELVNKLSHKEMLELYRIIREEEDRAKGLSLKERSENRADFAFAWMVSQAKAGQITQEDIALLDDEVKQALQLFQGDDGSYKLPIGSIPTIRSSAKAAPA